jgi:hypothetical protein
MKRLRLVLMNGLAIGLLLSGCSSDSISNAPTIKVQSSSLAGSSMNAGDATKSPLTNDEVSLCAEILGVDFNQIHYTGGSTSVNVEADKPLAVKVSGDQAKIHLDIGDQSTVSLKGLCLFATGNQSVIDVSVRGGVERIAYIGRGNHSLGEVTVAESGSVGAFRADLRGNAPNLRVHGVAECPDLLTGDPTWFYCELY